MWSTITTTTVPSHLMPQHVHLHVCGVGGALATHMARVGEAALVLAEVAREVGAVTVVLLALLAVEVRIGGSR